MANPVLNSKTFAAPGTATGVETMTIEGTVNKTAFAQEALEVLPDLQHSQNLRINSETDLVAPLSTAISLKVGYVIRFDNLPPAGFKKTDRILTTGIQIAL